MKIYKISRAKEAALVDAVGLPKHERGDLIDALHDAGRLTFVSAAGSPVWGHSDRIQRHLDTARQIAASHNLSRVVALIDEIRS